MFWRFPCHTVPVVILTEHIFRDVIFVKWLDEINSIMTPDIHWQITFLYDHTNFRVTSRVWQRQCYAQMSRPLCPSLISYSSLLRSRFSAHVTLFCFLHGTQGCVKLSHSVCNSEPCLSLPFQRINCIVVSVFVSLPPWHIIDTHRY